MKFKKKKKSDWRNKSIRSAGYLVKLLSRMVRGTKCLTIHSHHASSFKSTPGRGFFMMVVVTRNVIGLGRGSFSL